MKGGTRAAVVGFSLANLYLLSLTGPLVAPQHELIFHFPGSATLLFLPAILDVLLLSALIAAALLVVSRYPRAELLLWSALLLALPAGLTCTAFGFAGRSTPAWLIWPLILIALLAFLLIGIRVRSVLPRFPRVRSKASLLLAFLAPPMLLFFVQLLWYGWQARALNPPFTTATSPQLAPATPSETRVLWIILDELSFDQVYGHRLPGLPLPNFDRLASESVVFTHAHAAAEYTRTAVPSLLTGLALRRTQPSPDGQTLTLYPAQAGEPTRLTPSDTVFGDARKLGLPTAVAGWYEPYCRLLPGVLDRCTWTYADELPAGLEPEGTVLQQTVRPFTHFAKLCLRALEVKGALPAPGTLDVHRHGRDYTALLTAGDQLLASQPAGLTLLHMPIPHPWGFFDRRTGTFPDHQTSYLDNLALADAYIGHIRAQLEQKTLWKGTTVLIMGDHSWRTQSVWRQSGHWTDEEATASRNGAYDDRPAVILKLSGETAPARIDARFDAVRTRDLLKSLMTGRITTPEQVEAWIRDGSPSHPGATTLRRGSQ